MLSFLLPAGGTAEVEVKLQPVNLCFVCLCQQNLPEGAQNVGSLNLTYISKVSSQTVIYAAATGGFRLESVVRTWSLEVTAETIIEVIRGTTSTHSSPTRFKRPRLLDLSLTSSLPLNQVSDATKVRPKAEFCFGEFFLLFAVAVSPLLFSLVSWYRGLF